MSEQTMACWNAIPLERSAILKRRRPEDFDIEDGDDVSLVSRSPSHEDDAMDVDKTDVHKYDEYHRGPAREVITVDTKIKPTNKGFLLLSRLGWVDGEPVGLSGDGRIDPVPFQIKADLTGLGKTSQDVRMIETTVSQRRELDSERQHKESDEQRRLREHSVARKTALQSEISSTLKSFYCSLCEKQFKNVAQYDEHTNSYAHHHKARFRDMQAAIRIKPQEEVDKRKEKERKREEKELRRIAAASGIKLAKAPVGLASGSSVSGIEIDGKLVEPKNSSWASISAAGSSSVSFERGFANPATTSSAWTTVGDATSKASTPPQQSLASYTTSQFGLARPFDSQPSFDEPKPHIPTFRNAGWTSLDTGSSQPIPQSHRDVKESPLPSMSSAYPSSSSFSSSYSYSKSFLPMAAPLSNRPLPLNQLPSPPPPPFVYPPLPPSPPLDLGSLPPLPPSPLPPPPSSMALPATPKPSNSNWKQFQKGVSKRK